MPARKALEVYSDDKSAFFGKMLSIIHKDLKLSGENFLFIDSSFASSLSGI